MFQKVDAYAGDPILTLMERFKEDPRSDKVNLSIGLYYNEDGIIPQLKAVADAEARLNAQPHGASLYLPMEGLNSYRHAIAPLLFGADHPVLQQQRVATIQTLGGSGALKVGADFLKRYFPESGVWVSDPTWENHVAIFAGAGFEVSTYPWYDEATNGVRFNDLLATLKTLPARSIVLLHPCCHNPTGADLTNDQWDSVIEILKARELIPSHQNSAGWSSCGERLLSIAPVRGLRLRHLHTEQKVRRRARRKGRKFSRTNCSPERVIQRWQWREWRRHPLPYRHQILDRQYRGME